MSPYRVSAAGHAADYVELTKPRLTALAVASTLVGFVLGNLGPVRWDVAAWTLLGASFVGGGGNALNEWLERDADARMRRTSRRPLPTHRLRPEQALAWGLLLSVAGIAALSLVNGLTGLLGLLTVVSYVGLYTPMKRVTPLCTLIGAIPGAMPPLIGWTAATDGLALGGWVLFGLLFLWQLPHFLAIAWMCRGDYAAAGFRMLPSIDPEGDRTARQLILYTVALLPVSLLPPLIGLSGRVYFAGALLAGAGLLALTVRAARERTVEAARRVFLGSISYLPILMILLVWDRGPR